MLRHLFLFLSHHRALRRWMETSSLPRATVRRFVSGQRLEDAIRVCRELASAGYLSTLDHLGENVLTKAEAAESRDTMIEALDQLKAAGLESSVSIKLTQFGLDLSPELCLKLAGALAARARENGTRVEVDMESSEYTSATLDVVEELQERHGCIRAVLQAYLFRTEKDARRLCRAGIPVRLCKGAYDEGGDVAFHDKADVDANYLQLARTLLDSGTQAAIATHDPKMIAGVLDHARQTGRVAADFEFQMLYGVRRDLQQRLVDEGWRVRLYVPYGVAWYPYFMRRLAERPANVLFIARNLLRR
ncbi:MAG TPA: proline dehydrogenase family protein [Bryobacteraceae bacterium]|nr:proline dehydrogenase family protein [Bryobacteraceae bacterium]HPT26369.1 proline dehydrogenase family protein [Bryobacteraceae bacterium]